MSPAIHPAAAKANLSCFHHTDWNTISAVLLLICCLNFRTDSSTFHSKFPIEPDAYGICAPAEPSKTEFHEVGGFMTKVLVCLAAALLFVSSLPAFADTFTFDSIPLGTTTPFTSASSGSTTGQFSSPDGQFQVAASFFAMLPGQVLIDFVPSTLEIVLSQPQQSVSLLFGLNTSSLSTTLNLQALLGANPVGSASATGTIPPGFFFPEGSISFSGGIFDQIRLTSAAPNFAVDTIDVTPVATTIVPEPATVSLIISGLAVIAVSRRRRSCV
jgi:hypothetical protein